jgi:peptidoglycan/LPS O-acetylase OafA/YrhL
MEGLRGVAVFLVFLVHYSSLAESWLAPASTTFLVAAHLHNIGNAGVDLFFVLSGYLIYGMVLRKPVPFGSYLARRVQRIYPTFLVVLGIYLVLARFAPGARVFPPDWPGRVAYVTANLLLLPGMFAITPIITVAWSLSYEFFYYLVVPATIGLLAMRKWTPRARVALVAAVALGGFAVGWSHTGHIRLLMFVAGILLFELTTALPVRVGSVAGTLGFAGAIAAMVAVKVFGLSDAWQCLMLFVCFLVLCLDAFEGTGRTARILSAPALRAFGNVSYSYYLMHGLTLKIAFLVLAVVYPARHASAWPFWALIVPAFALTLVPSVGLFMLVEKPLSLSRARTARRADLALAAEPVNA